MKHIMKINEWTNSRLGKDATKADKKESFDIIELTEDVFEMNYKRLSFFHKSGGTWLGAKGTMREIWSEYYEKIKDFRQISLNEFIGPNASRGEHLIYLTFGKTKTYYPKDIDSLEKILEECYTQKTAPDFMRYMAEKVGTAKIECKKDDQTYWRYKGEKEWRRIPIFEK